MNVLRHVNAINMGVCILIWVIGCANAKVLKRCILPAPDGGVEKLSKPNLHGVIKKVDLNTNEAKIKIGVFMSYILSAVGIIVSVVGVIISLLLFNASINNSRKIILNKVQHIIKVLL